MYEAAQGEKLSRQAFLYSRPQDLRRKLAACPAVPSQHRQLFFNALFAEMLQDRCVSSRGRSVPRGVKRKMGHYPIRHPIPPPKYPLRRAAVIHLAILR